jgi:hypothetical protein
MIDARVAKALARLVGLKEFQRTARMVDTRRWGPGERLVFEPYTKEVYTETFRWIADHGIFADTSLDAGTYEQAVVRLP